jgi:hypothetical protein
VLGEVVPGGVVGHAGALLGEPVDPAVRLDPLHVGDVGREPALLEQIGRTSLVEAGDVRLPGGVPRPAVAADGEQAVADRVERLGQAGEPRHRDPGGGEDLELSHPAGIAGVERVQQGDPQPRVPLALHERRRVDREPGGIVDLRGVNAGSHAPP